MEAQSGSEVSRILKQIELEYQAAHAALTSYSVTSSHEFITARMENMGRLHQSLRQIVGEDAMKLVAERLESIGQEEERLYEPECARTVPDL
ncbi:MAG TPA: hypothetical protein VFV38_50105 [Ktedonobacteraceae bacterium]|nr:hypothetical protein [Ktedonobacteraceae bacterium]